MKPVNEFTPLPVALFRERTTQTIICNLSTKRFWLHEDGGIQEECLPLGHYAKWTPRRHWTSNQVDYILLEDGAECQSKLYSPAFFPSPI